MTAILGVFSFGEEAVPQGVAHAMLARMSRRGADETRTWSDGHALLCASRHRWELNVHSAGSTAVARHDHLAVVADAALYYRDDLRRRLGVSRHDPKVDSASHLLLLAFEQWGERCVDYLEGDYACIVWDARERRVFLARDFTGQRPLFYSRRGSTLVVASTIGGVVAHPAVRSYLNLAAIAIDASALLYSAGTDTCYRDVSVMPAGSAVIVSAAGARVSRWWNPIVSASSNKPIADAAVELKEVLGDAVLQRASETGVTSVWLSGGRDSTAVFAAGQHALVNQGLPASLRPVSLRLAADDPLNEDRFIQVTADRWQSHIAWLDVADLGPMVEAEGSGARDEPHRHLYQSLVRRLSEKSLTVDARVALSGHGGDFLFEVSPVILADYLASLRIRSFLREWRALDVGNRRRRGFVQWAIAPLLPSAAHNTIAWFRGRPLRGYYERSLPTWLAPAFIRQHDLVARARAGAPRASRVRRCEYEMQWFLTEAYFPRTAAICAEYALDAGVELRAPMMDARVVRLAASRPAFERRNAGQSKILLRRAMDGLLPESVLAPRPFKTGTLANYSSQGLVSLGTVMQREFRDSMLVALGIADADELRRVADRFAARVATRAAAEQLVSALQCELWLKARLGRIRDSDDRDAAGSASPSAHVTAFSKRNGAPTLVAHASGTSRQPLGVGGL